jgi:hypothetical protein
MGVSHLAIQKSVTPMTPGKMFGIKSEVKLGTMAIQIVGKD